MRFLIDAQLPPMLVEWLAWRGHEAGHVGEIGLVAADDADVAARAEADRAVLVSKDEDFVMLRLPDRYALLWLRCGNTTNRALYLAGHVPRRIVRAPAFDADGIVPKVVQIFDQRRAREFARHVAGPRGDGGEGLLEFGVERDFEHRGFVLSYMDSRYYGCGVRYG